MHDLVGHYGVSTRRACRVVATTCSSLYYRRRKDPLVALRQGMRELAQTRVRFGYRLLRVLLQREGWEVGKERFYRVYTEEGLALRRKRPWRHATAVHREQRRPATARNDIWSMDVVADELADGRRFRTLTVIDLFTSECLAIEVGQRLGGQDVAAALKRLRFARGLPQRIYCDNGTECVSAAMDLWAYINGVVLDFSRRGKPTHDRILRRALSGRVLERALVRVARGRAAQDRCLSVGL
jgi:putative transposase